MFTASLLLLCASVCPPVLDGSPPEVGKVAPPHGVERWEGFDEEATERVARGGEPPKKGKLLTELHGQVVFLFAVRGAPDPEALRLVLDFLRANADREVSGLGLVAHEDLVGTLRSRGFSSPLGILDEAGSPYLPVVGPAALTVIGRSGEVVWTGDPAKGEKDLLAACHDALMNWPALALEGDLDEALDDAVAAYFAGDWAKARKLAKKVAARAEDPELAEDVTYLTARLDELEFALLEDVRGTTGAWKQLRLLRLHRALARGFPSSRALEECANLLENRRKTLGAGSLLDDQNWIELEPDRPVLFPLRKDAAGKRFAKKIGKLIRNANDTELTRLVRDMLATFEAL